MRAKPFFSILVLLFLGVMFPLFIIVTQQKQKNKQYAAGNDLYVSTTGSDANNGSQTSPFATINKAATIATPGTTVHVVPGTYTVTSSIKTYTSGTATARITYISDAKWGAKIVGHGPFVIWDSQGDYIDVAGFDITGDGSYGLQTLGSYVRFIGNDVHNIPGVFCSSAGGGGLIAAYQNGGHDDEIIGNITHDIGQSNCKYMHGIYIANTHSIAWNNITYHNSGWGIQLWHAANADTLGNNVVFENQTGGITIGDGAPPGGVIADNIIVTNNIIVHNYGARAGLYEYAANGNIGINQYIDNLVYANAPVNVFLKNTATGTIISEPQFVNYQANGSGDYHLKSTSPAIDTGTAIGAPTRDFDGNTRPQGKGFDIGAYEYSSLTISLTPTPTPKVSQNPTSSPFPSISSSLPPNSTVFTVTTCPHGLGNCGDNANPNSKGNISPQHTTRNLTLAILDTTGNFVASARGTVIYNRSSQNYQGNITVQNLSSGQYLVSVKMDEFLGKQIPGIVSVTQGQTLTLSSISLTTGDINNDNQLDILDYNILISCFGSKFTASSCHAPSTFQSHGADIDDDGIVDGTDFNLFLRELSMQRSG